MMQADVIPAEAAVDFDSDSEGDLPVAVVLAEAIFVEDGDVPHLQAVNDQHPRRDELLLLQQQQRQDDPHNADLNHPVLVRYSNLRGRISSYLFDMIREECTCTSILSGWSPQLQGCNRVVDHCHQFQEEAFYVSPNGRTALHEACLRGSCTHVLEALLQANSFGAMDRDHHGNTPLHLLFVDFRCAVSSQEMDAMVQQLVAVNPALLASSINMDGSTALHMACTCPETMISSNSFVRLLQASPSCATKLNGRNQTPLLLHCQRRNATTQVAQILLQANPDALTILDGDDGWAPLHYAASHANVELVQYLVQTNPQAARVRTLQSFSALHLLCRQSLRLVHLPAMDALLRADPDSVLQQDAPHSYTPLHLLCRSPRLDPEFAKRLVQTNPHAAAIPDADNYLPLHHACDIGSSFEIVSLLLQTYPEAACQSTRKQDSALSLACACNQSVETVRLLIDANHHALLLKNDYGFCALHCVCRAYQPRMGIVQALLEACPSCVTMKTHAGETPVHLACSNSGAFVGVLQLLTMAQNQTNICDNSSNSTNIQGNDNALVGMEEDTNPSRNKRMTNKIGNTPRKYQQGSQMIRRPSSTYHTHASHMLLPFYY
jgi:ankyrin repeat protein